MQRAEGRTACECRMIEPQARHLCHTVHRRGTCATPFTGETPVPHRSQARHLCHTVHRRDACATPIRGWVAVPHRPQARRLCHTVHRRDGRATPITPIRDRMAVPHRAASGSFGGRAHAFGVAVKRRERLGFAAYAGGFIDSGAGDLRPAGQCGARQVRRRFRTCGTPNRDGWRLGTCGRTG
jgi:hypothetical protein